MPTPENAPTGEHPTESTPDDRIQSPHDRLINQTLQQAEAAQSLIKRHLPSEVVQYLKLHTLAHVDTSFIDRNLRRRFADRLFSVEVTDEIVSNLGMPSNRIYVLVLIDHKSSEEPHVLIQMLGYVVRIWENALENNQPLVPIIPWVIYNGVNPWRNARRLDQLIPVPESWKRYVPGLELAILLDVSRMDDAAMVGDPILQVALTLLKYGRTSELDGVLRNMFQMVSQVISQQQAKNLLDTIRVYVMSVNPVLGEEKLNELVSEFWPVQPEPGSVADQLIKKGEARGEARGEAKGEARGMANTIRTLQAILGIPPSSDETLAVDSPEALQATIDSLQQQISSRLN